MKKPTIAVMEDGAGKRIKNEKTSTDLQNGATAKFTNLETASTSGIRPRIARMPDRVAFPNPVKQQEYSMKNQTRFEQKSISIPDIKAKTQSVKLNVDRIREDLSQINEVNSKKNRMPDPPKTVLPEWKKKWDHGRSEMINEAAEYLASIEPEMQDIPIEIIRQRVESLPESDQHSFMNIAYQQKEWQTKLNENLELKALYYTYETWEAEIEIEKGKLAALSGLELERQKKRIAEMESLRPFVAMNTGNLAPLEKELDALWGELSALEAKYQLANNNLANLRVGADRAAAYMPRDFFSKKLQDAEEARNTAMEERDAAQKAYEEYLSIFYWCSRSVEMEKAKQVKIGDQTLWDIVNEHAQGNKRKLWVAKERNKVETLARKSGLDLEELLEFSSRLIDIQKTEELIQKTETSTNRGGWNGIMNSVLSVGAKTVSGVGMLSVLGQQAANKFREPADQLPINYYNQWHAPVNFANEVRGTVDENIREWWEKRDQTLAGDVMANVYSFGMGIADVAASVLVGKGASSVTGVASLGSAIASTVMNSAEFADTFVRMKQNGASDSTAFNRCAGDFILNTIGENISLNKILSRSPDGGWKAVCNSGAIESLQNIGMEAGKLILDYAINAEDSQWGEAYNMYLLSGASEAEAEMYVIRDSLQQLGWVGIQALASGMTADVANQAYIKQQENAKIGRAVVENGELRALIEEAQNLPISTRARNLADRIFF